MRIKKNSYKLKKDKNNQTWVTVDLLAEDVKQHLEVLSDLDTGGFDQRSQNEYNLRLIGLQAIYTFLGALITEQITNDLYKKAKVKTV